MFKSDFPIFKRKVHGKELVYLDSASTSQKPQQVIDAVTDLYMRHNSNIHRGIYTLSEEATSLYEGTRKKIANFIGADTSEIIFTGNTNEAINQIAQGFAKKYLKKGDIVVLSHMEHHANIIPWQRLVSEIGIKLHYLPIDKYFRLNFKSINSEKLDLKKIKIVSLTHASNVLGTINPIKEIIAHFKNIGIDAAFIVDAAQSIPHIPVNVKDLDCDFLAFSSHKMLGPSGLGVLWGKAQLLEQMDPLFVGSQMIKTVTLEECTLAEVPYKFEVGTGRIEAVVGLGAAIDYLQKISVDLLSIEQELTEYALNKLKEVEGLTIFGPKDSHNRLGVFSFSLGNIHPHDVAQILDREGICVRSGHHCAQPLMGFLRVKATTRASIYLYNSKEDIDKLISGIEKVKQTFKN